MSCVDAIAAITEFIRTAIDKKAQGQACYIDLQKAFIGEVGKLWPLRKHFVVLRDYLSDRRQYISHNGVCTEKFKTVSGVPQGSVLGPFLFLLYINDIHLGIGKCTMAMLADDTKISSWNAKVFVQFNQIWTIYCIGFVNLNLV